jgi:peptidoglycan/LPS O-acetylase OafA/YrhL
MTITSISIDNPLGYFAVIATMYFVALGVTRWVGFYTPSQRERSENSQRNQLLESLRGLLCSTVVAVHALHAFEWQRTGTWTFPEGSVFYNQIGSGAVLLFFFLSGFVFWNKFLQLEHFSLSTNLWPFYRNRILRLYPSLVVLFSLFGIAIAWKSHFQLHEPLLSLIKNCLQWVTLQATPDINGIPNTWIILIASVTWTLIIESKFYALIPFLYWFSKGSRLIWLGLGIVILSSSLDYLTLRLPTSLSGLGPLTTFFKFMLIGFLPGMFIAWLQQYWNISFKRIPNTVKTLIIVACFFLIGFMNPGMYGVKQSALLILPFAFIANGYSCHGFLNTSAVRHLGQISYSVYLFHGTFIYLGLTTFSATICPIPQLTAIQYWGFVMLLSILVVLFASLTYRFVEYPFIQGHRRPQKSPPLH